ncbi:hypothetical protein LINPERPRIM_LOCUS19265 [Linum perenne]
MHLVGAGTSRVVYPQLRRLRSPRDMASSCRRLAQRSFWTLSCSVHC